MLELKNIYKTFNPGTVNEKRALQGLSLSLADEVILTDIYPAREAPIPGISSLLIYNLLRPGIEKRLCRKDEVAELVGLEDIEVLIILGAGDLDNYAADIAQKLAAKG